MDNITTATSTSTTATSTSTTAAALRAGLAAAAEAARAPAPVLVTQQQLARQRTLASNVFVPFRSGQNTAANIQLAKKQKLFHDERGAAIAAAAAAAPRPPPASVPIAGPSSIGQPVVRAAVIDPQIVRARQLFMGNARLFAKSVSKHRLKIEMFENVLPNWVLNYLKHLASRNDASLLEVIKNYLFTYNICLGITGQIFETSLGTSVGKLRQNRLKAFTIDQFVHSALGSGRQMIETFLRPYNCTVATLREMMALELQHDDYKILLDHCFYTSFLDTMLYTNVMPRDRWEYEQDRCQKKKRAYVNFLTKIYSFLEANAAHAVASNECCCYGMGLDMNLMAASNIRVPKRLRYTIAVPLFHYTGEGSDTEAALKYKNGEIFLARLRLNMNADDVPQKELSKRLAYEMEFNNMSQPKYYFVKRVPKTVGRVLEYIIQDQTAQFQVASNVRISSGQQYCPFIGREHWPSIVHGLYGDMLDMYDTDEQLRIRN